VRGIEGADLAIAGLSDCPGDCDDDRRVGVHELVLAVDISLDGAEPAACASLDVDASGLVSIDELVLAVQASLTGCPVTPTPSPPPTLAASPTSSPTPSPTEPGLGVRRFSIDPSSSPLTAVLAGDEISTLPGFSGFLELGAGEPDAKTGMAFVDITGASEYIAIDIPAEPAALCIRPLRDRFPVERAGIVACNGGLPAGFVSRQDHRLGVVGECSGGNAAGSSCESRDDCPGGSCFSAADCETNGGRIEEAEEPHPGVCNGPPTVGLLPGDAGPGAVWIVPGLAEGATQGLVVEILMEEATPCGDEDVPAVPAVLSLISARVEVDVSNVDDRPGQSLSHEVSGESFACDRWREEDGPGTLVFGGPGLDVRAVGAVPMDVITFFVLDD
jgi:hypothetical protein